MPFQEEIRGLIRAAVPGVPVDWGWNLQGTTGTRVTLAHVSGSDGATHDGPTGLITRRVQVDVWSPSYGAARNTADDIRHALHATRSGNIAGVFLTGTREGPPDTPAGDVLARFSLDLTVHYKESST